MRGRALLGLIFCLCGILQAGAPQEALAATVSEVAPLPASRNHLAVAFDGQRAFITGGMSSGPTRLDFAIDPMTGESTERPAPNVDGSQSTTIGRDVFIFEGTSSATSVTRYNLDAGTWTTTDPGLPGLADAAVASDGQKVYLFGGSKPGTTVLYNSVLEYDPGTGEVAQVAILPRSPVNAAAVFIPQAVGCSRGCFFVFGGKRPSGVSDHGLPIVQFDPETKQVSEIASEFPSYRENMGKFVLNGRAYLFGGRYSTVESPDLRREIFRFDPATRTVTMLALLLPFGIEKIVTAAGDGVGYLYGGQFQDARSFWSQNYLYRFDPLTETLSAPTKGPLWTSSAAGAWDGARFRLIGGSGERILEEVAGFDASTRSVFDPGLRMPVGLVDHSAVWAQDRAFIFGGQHVAGLSDRIYRLDPATGAVVELHTRLPTPRRRMSVAFDGSRIYLFGGYSTSGTALADVLSFDPATGALQRLAAQLPQPSGETSATWNGSSVFIFGGGTTEHESIYMFEPSTQSIGTAPAKLRFRAGGAITYGQMQIGFGSPGAVYGISAAGAIKKIYDISSNCSDGPTSICRTEYSSAFTDGTSIFLLLGNANIDFDGGSAVHEFRLTPGMPDEVRATRGTQRGTISVTWRAPGSLTYPDDAPIQEFRIYRSSAPNAPRTLAGSVPATEGYFLDTGLADGTTWYYRVSAVNAHGEGPLSQKLWSYSATTISLPKDVTLQPGVSPGRGQIEIRWAPPDDGGTPITAYRVYTSSTSPADQFIAEVSGSSRSFVHSGLGDGEWRTYRVTAVNEVGEGPFGPSQLYVSSPTRPSAARNPSTEMWPPGAVTIRWQPADPGSPGWVASYRVTRRLLSGPTKIVGSTTATSFVDRTCPLAEVCYYSITSSNAVGDGPSTAEVFAPGSALFPQ